MKIIHDDDYLLIIMNYYIAAIKHVNSLLLMMMPNEFKWSLDYLIHGGIMNSCMNPMMKYALIHISLLQSDMIYILSRKCLKYLLVANGKICQSRLSFMKQIWKKIWGHV